jgi:hypothetical protein
VPIRPPALDDRSFDDLVAELLARIPAHTPEWTHPRVGDPGRTLIDLFAWLGDTVLYRANLIPERQRLAFLRLLGQPLKPAVSARGIVALEVDDDAAATAIDVRAGAVIEKPVPFQTTGFVTAYPLQAQVYIKRRLDTDAQHRFTALLPDLARVYRLEGTPVGYETTQVFENGLMHPAGVDFVADSVDQSLWIALLAPSARALPAARATLAPEATGPNAGSPRAINVGLALTLEVPGLDENLGPRARIPVDWEIATGATGSAPALLALEKMADATEDLSKSGVVRLSLPDPAFIGAPANDPRDNLNAGVGDSPPRIDNPADAQRLVTWLRLRIRRGFPINSCKLSWAGVNAVELVQAESLPSRVLGSGDGGSDQVFDLGTADKGSVDARQLRIDVADPTQANTPWFAVDDLGSAGPLDPVYRLDAEAATVTFGDGVHGRVPSAGSQITARQVVVGGGVRGNLGPQTLATVDAIPHAVTGARTAPAKPLKIKQPLPLGGGQDAETVELAERRIPAYIRHRDRAVTAEDYRTLARQAPGVEVGRIAVLPLFKPHERQGDIPGVLSVMVWPNTPSSNYLAPYPRADRPLLEAVHGFLDSRRPLATELYSIGCAYLPLGVSIAVQIADGFVREEVLANVRLALRRYFWPLPLGPQGSVGDWPTTARLDGGYPLGRTVTDRELEVVAARVPGVESTSAVRLFERRVQNGQLRFVELPGKGKAITQFKLEAWELPELTALSVTEGNDAASTLADAAAPGDDAIAVPIVPEVC